MLGEVENYRKAVERFWEALPDFARNPDSTGIRDGVILRFAFTFDPAWKSIWEYLEDQGRHEKDRVLQAGIQIIALAERCLEV